MNGGKERGMGGREKKQKEKRKKEGAIEGGGGGRGGETRGSLRIDVGIVGERKKEIKGKNCRSSTRRKGKDMEGRRE